MTNISMSADALAEASSLAWLNDRLGQEFPISGDCIARHRETERRRLEPAKGDPAGMQPLRYTPKTPAPAARAASPRAVEGRSDTGQVAATDVRDGSVAATAPEDQFLDVVLGKGPIWLIVGATLLVAFVVVCQVFGVHQ